MKRIILTALALCALSVGIVANAASSKVYAADTTDAQTKSDLCSGVNATSAGTDANGNPVTTCADTSGSISNTVANLINLFSLIIGLTAVIMIMVGGFKYVTASGDSSKVSSAKTTITYAIVGLIIVLMAQSLVHFVINRVTTTPPAKK